MVWNENKNIYNTIIVMHLIHFFSLFCFEDGQETMTLIRGQIGLNMNNFGGLSKSLFTGQPVTIHTAHKYDRNFEIN